jgi:redox-sensitive bicupin YhaK (pirin superfamily)
MIKIRPSSERGKANLGWLDTRYSFSFSNYFDPQHMGFKSLRVINEDKVNPGGGFPTHGHQDMEIITYILQGALEHKDSIGNGSIISPGEVQRMSAGTGILHSEFNPSADEAVHLLQIWILPEKKGIQPSYEQKTFTEAEKSGQLRLIASQDGRGNSVTINQDVNLYATLLKNGETVIHQTTKDRGVWLQIIKGSIVVSGQVLSNGDGAAITEETTLKLTGNADLSEVLLFDML